MDWYAQLIGVIATVASFLLALVTFLRQGVSLELVEILIFLFFIIVASAIWSSFATSDERGLESESKKIHLLKNLYDSPGLPPQHLALVKGRLEEETRSALDICMSWKKQANRRGIGVGFVAVGITVAVIGVPIQRAFLDSSLLHTQTFPHASGETSLTAFAFQLVFLAVLWTLIYKPVYDRVQTWFLKMLRETNGDFKLVPYIVQSLFSFRHLP